MSEGTLNTFPTQFSQILYQALPFYHLCFTNGELIQRAHTHTPAWEPQPVSKPIGWVSSIASETARRDVVILPQIQSMKVKV